MPRKPADPKYRLYKRTGQAVVTLTDRTGGRQDVYLETYNTPGSWERYSQEIARWKAKGCRLFRIGTPTDFTAELVNVFSKIRVSTADTIKYNSIG